MTVPGRISVTAQGGVHLSFTVFHPPSKGSGTLKLGCLGAKRYATRILNRAEYPPLASDVGALNTRLSASV